MERGSSGRKRAIEELTEGRKLAKQLQQILLHGADSRTSNSNTHEEQDRLLHKVLSSFTVALSILSSAHPPSHASQDSGDSTNSSSLNHSPPSPRGCYKRRKNSHSWYVDSSAWTHDGYAWRKYGQKVILNAKYPRNYFRCTHKSEGCQATKQVQRIKEEPPLYRTTYYGTHTCKRVEKDPGIIMDSFANDDNSVLISFGTNNTNKQECLSPHNFSSFPSVKQEDAPAGSTLTQNYQSSDYLVSSPYPDHNGDGISGADSTPTTSSSHSWCVNNVTHPPDQINGFIWELV